jgi:multidrug efflux pump subunit AcrB
VAGSALCPTAVFASVLILSLTVIGIFSFAQLGIDQFPTLTFRPSS